MAVKGGEIVGLRAITGHFMSNYEPKFRRS